MSEAEWIGKGNAAGYLSEDEVRALVEQAFGRWDVRGQKVLVIVPDGTRTAPIPLFFRLFHEMLAGKVRGLDYLVALGTHPVMNESALQRRVGITAQERAGRYKEVGIYNHRWDLAETFVTLGQISADETHALSNG